MSGHLINTLREEPAGGENDRFNGIVESILVAVEDREMARSAQMDPSMTSPPSRLKVAETLGGPLSSHDLSKLSVLCSEVFGATGTPGSEIRSSTNFSTVDVDNLSRLCAMLEIHIEQAASIDLIKEVHELLQQKKKQNTNSSTGGRSVLVEEVSLFLQFYSLLLSTKHQFFLLHIIYVSGSKDFPTLSLHLWVQEYCDT